MNISLINRGFYLYKKPCSCNGRTEKYKSHNMNIEIWIKKGVYQIIQYNKIVDRANDHNIELILQKYDPIP